MIKIVVDTNILVSASFWQGNPYKIMRLSAKGKIEAFDPEDNKVLEAAAETKAGYIVSGDKHLLKLKEFEGIKIVKAKEFLEEMK